MAKNKVINSDYFIDRISHECGVTARCAEVMLKCLTDHIEDAMTRGELVSINNFGVFRPIMKRINPEGAKRCRKVIFTGSQPMLALLRTGER